MPMNSDSRCTGICLTAEAILDGELLSGGHDKPQEVARRIYDAIGTSQPVRFRSACICGWHAAAADLPSLSID